MLFLCHTFSHITRKRNAGSRELKLKCRIYASICVKSGLVGMLCRNTKKMTVTSETESRGKRGLETDDWNRITIKLLQSSAIVKGSLLLRCKRALLNCEDNMRYVFKIFLQLWMCVICEKIGYSLAAYSCSCSCSVV